MSPTEPIDYFDEPSVDHLCVDDLGLDPPPTHAVLCPYCGSVAIDGRCQTCGGLLEPLSKQATQNDMGPWFIRDLEHPFGPGCSYTTLRKLAMKGRLAPKAVIRGPSTRQFWSFARNVRGVAHLLGECHNCHGPASADEYMCRSCGAVFEAPTDRQHFGAGPVRLIPGQAPPDIVARSILDRERRAKTEVAGRPHKQPRQVGAKTAPPHANATQAVQKIRRRLKSSRRIVVISVAVNMVLLMTILIMSLSSSFTVGARRAAPLTTADEPAALAPVNAAAPRQPVVSDEIAQRIARARKLASSDNQADLQAAERMLQALVDEIPEDRRPAAVDELLARAHQRLDQQSLSNFLPRDQSAGDD